VNQPLAQPSNVDYSSNVIKGPYFCPKRFNRFPRFSIFFKKGDSEANKYVAENTVSLSPEFLSILMENKDHSMAGLGSPITSMSSPGRQNSLKHFDEVKRLE
jgi:hypothetical protein